MDDQGDSAPAQWAADPSGRHRYRYWDGTRWSGHVYDGPDAPLAPPRDVPHEAAREAAPRRPERPTRMVVEPTDEDPTDHPRDRRAAPNRRSFLMGALAGGAVVAVIALIASIALGGGGGSTTTVTTRRRATTTTEATTSTTSLVTTTTLAAGRPPAQVRVEVLNGSGTAGAASTKAAALKTAGYTIAGTGNGPTRTGTVVQCKTGFESESAALTQAVGAGATNQPAGTAGVTVPSTADCVVIVGK
jgi:hypothetical protein